MQTHQFNGMSKITYFDLKILKYETLYILAFNVESRM